MAKKYIIKEEQDARLVVPLLTAENFTEINDYDYVKKWDEDSFADLPLRYYAELQKMGLTIEKLSELTGLQRSTISYYLNGKRVPTVCSLTALCIGMRLYYPRSLLLMKKAQLALDEDTLKDRICMKYLVGCGFDSSLTVDSCNRELRENGLSESVKRRNSSD